MFPTSTTRLDTLAFVDYTEKRRSVGKRFPKATDLVAGGF